jgi:hypothetical protein
LLSYLKITSHGYPILRELGLKTNQCLPPKSGDSRDSVSREVRSKRFSPSRQSKMGVEKARRGRSGVSSRARFGPQPRDVLFRRSDDVDRIGHCLRVVAHWLIAVQRHQPSDHRGRAGYGEVGVDSGPP